MGMSFFNVSSKILKIHGHDYLLYAFKVQILTKCIKVFLSIAYVLELLIEYSTRIYLP